MRGNRIWSPDVRFVHRVRARRVLRRSCLCRDLCRCHGRHRRVADRPRLQSVWNCIHRVAVSWGGIGGATSCRWILGRLDIVLRRRALCAGHRLEARRDSGRERPRHGREREAVGEIDHGASSRGGDELEEVRILHVAADASGQRRGDGVALLEITGRNERGQLNLRKQRLLAGTSQERAW